MEGTYRKYIVTRIRYRSWNQSHRFHSFIRTPFRRGNLISAKRNCNPKARGESSRWGNKFSHPSRSRVTFLSSRRDFVIAFCASEKRNTPPGDDRHRRRRRATTLDIDRGHFTTKSEASSARKPSFNKRPGSFFAFPRTSSYRIHPRTLRTNANPGPYKGFLSAQKTHIHTWRNGLFTLVTVGLPPLPSSTVEITITFYERRADASRRATTLLLSLRCNIYPFIYLAPEFFPRKPFIVIPPDSRCAVPFDHLSQLLRIIVSLCKLNTILHKGNQSSIFRFSFYTLGVASPTNLN